MMKTRWFRGACVLLALSAAEAPAVVFFSTGDPAHNTNAPSGALADSGWQYQGTFGDYLGTPIDPRHFLTAKHLLFITNTVNTFQFGGNTYNITGYYPNPTNDLMLVKVAQTFPTYAPLYTNNNESGRTAMMLGRGWERGSNVVVGGSARGWYYGFDPLLPLDPLNTKVLRWGTNTIAGFANSGTFLVTSFSSNVADEAHLGPGDSGGGLFIRDPADGQWKLAGVNYTISALYSTNSSGANPFWASLYDSSGLWLGSGSVWNPASGPSLAYETRVSPNVAWIAAVVPEPAPVLFLALTAAGALFWRRFRRFRGDN